MSDTPRTNVVIMQCHSSVDVEHAYMRMSEHAELLERELAAVTAERDAAKKDSDNWFRQYKAMKIGGPDDEERIEILEDQLAAVKKERDALLKEREWRPIATAPKDGTPFLGYDKTNEHPIMVHADYGRGCVMLGDEFNYISEPTHWMPLPEPPKDSEVPK